LNKRIFLLVKEKNLGTPDCSSPEVSEPIRFCVV
jgi:hypothetical protein